MFLTIFQEHRINGKIAACGKAALFVYVESMEIYKLFVITQIVKLISQRFKSTFL